MKNNKQATEGDFNPEETSLRGYEPISQGQAAAEKLRQEERDALLEQLADAA